MDFCDWVNFNNFRRISSRDSGSNLQKLLEYLPTKIFALNIDDETLPRTLKFNQSNNAVRVWNFFKEYSYVTKCFWNFTQY